VQISRFLQWESLARGGVDDTIRDSPARKAKVPLVSVLASAAIRSRRPGLLAKTDKSALSLGVANAGRTFGKGR
jgi:hypothetical protein